MAITESDLNNWFSYHPPADDIDVARYQTIREAGRTFASVLVANTPPSADQTAAVRHIRDAVMTANAAIVCQPPEQRHSSADDCWCGGMDAIHDNE